MYAQFQVSCTSNRSLLCLPIADMITTTSNVHSVSSVVLYTQLSGAVARQEAEGYKNVTRFCSHLFGCTVKQPHSYQVVAIIYNIVVCPLLFDLRGQDVCFGISLLTTSLCF